MSTTIVVTLGLAIGASTAVFSLADAIVLHPIAAPEANKLVVAFSATAENSYGAWSLADFRRIAARVRSLQSTAAVFTTSFPLEAPEAAEDITVALSTMSYFEVLRVRPQLGRTFTREDSVTAENVAVLNYSFWQKQYGADPAVLGKVIRLGGQLVTVVGVMPQSFKGANLAAVPDVWMPLYTAVLFDLAFMSQDGATNTEVPVFAVIGRLADGASNEAVAQELHGIRYASNNSSVAAFRGSSARTVVVPLSTAAAAVRDRGALMRFLQMLFAIVATTLSLACLNVANLLVIRARTRRREIGIHMALGATPAILAGQLLAEALLLATGGTVAGLACAMLGIRILSRLTLPGGIAAAELSLHPDVRALGFTIVLASATALAFGLAPAIDVWRTNVADIFLGRETAMREGRRRSALLAIQVGLALALLVLSGLFVRALRSALGADLGFSPNLLSAITTRPPFTGRHIDNMRPYLAIIDGVRKSGKGVDAAASTHLPLAPFVVQIFTEGPPMKIAPSNRRVVPMGMVGVTDGYFRVLQIPFVAGVGFDQRSGSRAERVVVLNESAAGSFWPHESAIGKQINVRDGVSYTVIGIVRDGKYRSVLDHNVAMGFTPMEYEDFMGGFVHIVAKSTPAAAGLERLLSVATTVAPQVKFVRPRLATKQIDEALAPQRLGMLLVSSFAAIALCITGMGIYGTVSYSFTRRTTEIGVRLALGATRADIIRLLTAEIAAALAGGAVIGAAAALVVSNLIRHYLLGNTTYDWVAFSSAALIMAMVAVCAAAGPARRAVRLDPVRALRSL